MWHASLIWDGRVVADFVRAGSGLGIDINLVDTIDAPYCMLSFFSMAFDMYRFDLDFAIAGRTTAFFRSRQRSIQMLSAVTVFKLGSLRPFNIPDL